MTATALVVCAAAVFLVGCHRTLLDAARGVSNDQHIHDTVGAAVGLCVVPLMVAAL